MRRIFLSRFDDESETLASMKLVEPKRFNDRENSGRYTKTQLNADQRRKRAKAKRARRARRQHRKNSK